MISIFHKPKKVEQVFLREASIVPHHYEASVNAWGIEYTYCKFCGRQKYDTVHPEYRGGQ
jgi:hypothetical protein